jgi:hypothetical protein
MISVQQSASSTSGNMFSSLYADLEMSRACIWKKRQGGEEMVEKETGLGRKEDEEGKDILKYHAPAHAGPSSGHDNLKRHVIQQRKFPFSTHLALMLLYNRPVYPDSCSTSFSNLILSHLAKRTETCLKAIAHLCRLSVVTSYRHPALGIASRSMD